MLEQNRGAFDAVGITKWMEAGYTGNGVKALMFERFEIPERGKNNIEILWPDKYYINPLTSDLGMHGAMGALVALEIAPDVKIYQTVDAHSADSEQMKWIMENRSCLGGRSISDPVRGFDLTYADTLEFLSLFNAVGNYGISDVAGRIADEVWFGVGAVSFINGELVPTSYSIADENVDFCGLTNVKITLNGINFASFTGTSCVPNSLGIGMCALVQQFFIEKVGRPLSHFELYNFIVAHCRDMHTPGEDDKTGHGVFIMPDPATLNPYDWVDDMIIKIPIGSKEYTIDGITKTHPHNLSQVQQSGIAGTRLKQACHICLKMCR